jgi:excisionase family DNA binding protein
MIVSLPAKNDVFFSTSEAASYLGFATDTVRRYVYRGLIDADRIGNSLVIRKSECDRYRREKRSPGKPKKS